MQQITQKPVRKKGGFVMGNKRSNIVLVENLGDVADILGAVTEKNIRLLGRNVLIREDKDHISMVIEGKEVYRFNYEGNRRRNFEWLCPGSENICGYPNNIKPVCYGKTGLIHKIRKLQDPCKPISRQIFQEKIRSTFPPKMTPDQKAILKQYCLFFKQYFGRNIMRA